MLWPEINIPAKQQDSSIFLQIKILKKSFYVLKKKHFRNNLNEPFQIMKSSLFENFFLIVAPSRLRRG